MNTELTNQGITEFIERLKKEGFQFISEEPKEKEFIFSIQSGFEKYEKEVEDLEKIFNSMKKGISNQMVLFKTISKEGNLQCHIFHEKLIKYYSIF